MDGGSPVEPTTRTLASIKPCTNPNLLGGTTDARQIPVAPLNRPRPRYVSQNTDAMLVDRTGGRRSTSSRDRLEFRAANGNRTRRVPGLRERPASLLARGLAPSRTAGLQSRRGEAPPYPASPSWLDGSTGEFPDGGGASRYFFIRSMMSNTNVRSSSVSENRSTLMVTTRLPPEPSSTR